MGDEQHDLDLIPRSVRDKLDRVSIKLHLRDWQRLSLDERITLVEQPCESSDDVSRYRLKLEDLIERRIGSTPEYLPRRAQ